MKLVDILARELKVFPESYRYILFDGANGCYADLGPITKPLTIDCSECDDELAFPVYREQWQAAVDALRAEANPAESMALHHQEVGRITRQWNGEGLPPAETVVELRTVSAKTDWAKAKIKFASRNVVVWDWDGEPAISGLCTAYAHAIEMRPIRTPEQIAAEERERVIDTMVKSCPYPGSGCTRIDCAALYDAGYRKFEILDN